MAFTRVFLRTILVLTLTVIVSGQFTFPNPSNSFGSPPPSANSQIAQPHMSSIGADAYNPSTDGSGLYRSNSGINGNGPSTYGSSTGPGTYGSSTGPGTYGSSAGPRTYGSSAGPGTYGSSAGPSYASSPGSSASAASPGSNAYGPSGRTIGHSSPRVQSSSPGGSRGSPARSSATAHSPDAPSKPTPPSDPLDGFRIVCLFNNKNFYKGGFSPAMIDSSLCTHVNYEFAILDPMTYEMITGEPDLDIQENFYKEAIDLKKWNPKLKVLLSLGGWQDSTKKYSEMAADSSKRKNFIEKAVEFLKAHGFDGMDLAWEYPNCWQGAIGVNSKDKDNFSLLLKELKAAFEAGGLELSASVGAIKREIEAAYDVPAVSGSVDHLNVMTYDMHGPWESTTGHHTQFEKREGDSDPYCNVKEAMKLWIDKGADKKKLNVGLAFYGKTFTLADPTKYEMGAAATGIGNPGTTSKNGGLLFYNEICNGLNSGNWTEKDEKSVGFYAYSDDQWVCYDPPMMVVRKAKYVVETGLGGVLLKDMSGDDFRGTCFSMPFPLTKMARLEMIQKIKRMKRQHG